MPEPSRSNPTNRFSGLAEVYARCRPDYPQTALDHILTRCGLRAGCLVVDVGSGTGILSRLLAQRGLRVIGIEPNADMRTQAEAEPIDGKVAPIYQNGRAEATGLPDGSADAVLAAQAFHWFDQEAALREFHRLLGPAGWAVLLWNERDESDPFTAAFGAVVASLPEAAAVEQPRGRAGDALLRCSLFEDARRDLFRHEQALTEEGLLGRAFSASYAPREETQAAQFAAELRQVFARYQNGGKVLLQYETSVYTARKGRVGPPKGDG